MSRNLLLVLLCLSTLSAFSQGKDAVLGKWLNPSGEGQILIYKAPSAKYSGKLIWLKEPHDEAGKPKTDIKNPKSSLRNQPLLGLEILKDFVFEDGRWVDGSIYDPKTGKTYSCTLTLKEDGQLNIRGYIGISLLGRSESWKRIK